jgi:hypothetical protein
MNNPQSKTGGLRTLAKAYADGRLTYEEYRAKRTGLLANLALECDGASKQEKGGMGALPDSASRQMARRALPVWMIPAAVVILSLVTLFALFLWGDKFDLE